MKRTPVWGKLSPEQLLDFDTLLLKMQKKNRPLLRLKKVPMEAIRPLDDVENGRLWEYIAHYAKLMVEWPNRMRAIRYFVSVDDKLSIDDIKRDAVMYIANHIYRYAWRKYRHSPECSYVFSTGRFGWDEWREKQDRRAKLAIVINNASDTFARHRGRKVVSVSAD